MDLLTKLDPKHTAVVVIDVQNDFASPDGLLAATYGRDLSEVAPMITQLEKLIAAAENKHVPVYYFQQIYDRAKLSPLKLEKFDLDGELATCDIGTDGYKFYHFNPPQEHVFVKYNYNIFSNSVFQQTLEDKGIKTLIITGMDTCYCVETAVRNAFDIGYKVVLPKDCVAGNGKYPELSAKTLLLTDKVFGQVSDVEEISKTWQTI